MEEVINERHLLSTKIREKFAFLYNRNSLFYYILILIGVGLGFFGFALVTQKFTTPFGGDFAQQYFAFEYNFYDDWWTFFKTGKFPFFDTNTFLGADNILANTYYGLFSPFTFPILLFPRSFVPHAMALMSIAKLVTGALLFRVYLKYIGVSETGSRTFGLAYAFMGWTAYYLWFNNFTEVLAFFPLILFGIEKIIREKQIWACSLGYFLMALGNYFFLWTFGIFGVIYAGFRFFQTLKERGGWKAWKEHLSVIGLGIAGFAIGFMIPSAVMAPALLSSFGISRSTEAKYFDLLKDAVKGGDFGKAAEIFFTWWHPNVISGTEPSKFYFAFAYPLASYFYPTVSCRYVTIVAYTSFENAGSSIFFFTPCIIMFCACLYRSFKLKKISHFIAIALCVICLFIPFFYFLSGVFTNNYGRWEIIVPALGLAYIAKNFDHRNEIPRWTIIISSIIALTGMILTLALALNLVKEYGGRLYAIENTDRMNVVTYEIIICVLEAFLICLFWKKTYLKNFVRIFIIIEAIVMGNIVANMHGLQNIYTDVNTGLDPMADQLVLIDDLHQKDASYYRMVSTLTDESHVNLPQAEDFNGLTTFHTFYSNYVDDFVHMTNMTCWDGSWASHYCFKHQYLESFLGVKYYLTRDSDTKYYNPDHVYEPNMPLNYSLMEHDVEKGYRIYKNEQYIDFGIAYDTLYYKHTSETNPKHNEFYKGNNLYSYLRNEEVLFKGAILNDDDLNEVVSQYPDIFNVYDKAPQLDMVDIGVSRKGVYAPYYVNPDDPNKSRHYYYINPENPTRDIQDIFLVDTATSTAPKTAYQIVYEPKNGAATFPIGENGGYYILNYPVRNPWTKYNACVWLIDENGKTISFDELRFAESDNTYVGRALYSRVPISKIIVCPMGDAYYGATPELYYESYDSVSAKLQKAADNGISDVTYNVNDFTFKTNYTKEKFVVTQLAYTDGWKLKAIASDGTVSYPKVYNAQGGFAGFVAPKGDVRYEMTYLTAGFAKWSLVSCAGLIALGGFTALPIIIRKRKEKRGDPLKSDIS